MTKEEKERKDYWDKELKQIDEVLVVAKMFPVMLIILFIVVVIIFVYNQYK